LPDWNSTAVELLIADAEGTVSNLDNAVSERNPEIAMRAIRNGRRAYEDIAVRRRALVLKPVDITTLERLLECVKERLRFLRERLA
jgi:hypothetical protein